MKYKEFKIGNLFDVQTSKSIDKGKLILNNTQKGHQFIGRTAVNNGIQGYVEKLSFEPNPKNTFSVSQIGQINAQFRESDWYASQNIFILTILNNKEEVIKNKLYFLTCINKALLIFRGGYTSYPTKKTLSALSIYLPVNSAGEIDFGYMEARIRELEEARIRELGAYLKVTGLHDYILSEEDQKLLKKFRQGEVRTSKFRVVDIFLVKNTHNILSRNIVQNSGRIPYLTAGQNHNAVSSYIKYNESFIEKGNSIFIGGKTFIVTYQENDYFSNDSHNLALYYRGDNRISKESQLFMVGAIKKSLSPIYSWGDSISSKKIQKDYIDLPVDKNGIPDLLFMENFIKAQQKLAIKNVIEWRDKQIEVTKSIIG